MFTGTAFFEYHITKKCQHSYKVLHTLLHVHHSISQFFFSFQFKNANQFEVEF